MAVTFAVSDLQRGNAGNKRVHTGLLTCSGTTSDNGDALTAEAIGLHIIDSITFVSALDSVSNPEAAWVLGYIKSGTGALITFHSQTTAGATTPLAAITDGTSVANYVVRFIAFGV